MENTVEKRKDADEGNMYRIKGISFVLTPMGPLSSQTRRRIPLY